MHVTAARGRMAQPWVRGLGTRAFDWSFPETGPDTREDQRATKELDGIGRLSGEDER